MDTVNIQIPAPDFNFADVVKRKAKTFISQHINESIISMTANEMIGGEDELYSEFDSALYQFKTDGLKITFIGELLLHLQRLKIKNSIREGEHYVNFINELQLYLYGLGLDCNYNFDTNAFEDSEVPNLNFKIDAILEKLNEIQLGQEIIFDEIGELRKDFESLKSDYILGKKSFYQRAAGIVVSYAGTKGADEVYDLLKPLLTDLFKTETRHLVDGITKLLS